MSNLEKHFQESLKFTILPSGKVQANFATWATFIRNTKMSLANDFKKNFPSLYKDKFDEFVDEVHPY